MEINLNLTIEDVNCILQHLGTGRFIDVKDLIVKIKQQGDAQAAAQQKASQPPVGLGNDSA